VPADDGGTVAPISGPRRSAASWEPRFATMFVMVGPGATATERQEEPNLKRPKAPRAPLTPPILDSIAEELHDRPGAVPGYLTPRRVFTRLLNRDLASPA
jgi:hypothetical protein